MFFPTLIKIWVFQINPIVLFNSLSKLGFNQQLDDGGEKQVTKQKTPKNKKTLSLERNIDTNAILQ